MISIIVVMYNMRREAARTLYSLSPVYQRDVRADEYEVLVVENGSSSPLDRSWVEAHGVNFHYLDMGAAAHPSPVRAVNEIVFQARGEHVGIIMDGARMVTPGMVAAARDALNIGGVVASLAWHIGDEHQSLSSGKGYSQVVEDRLLADLNWKSDGYRLFRRAAWAFSNPEGHFGFLAESCATFMSRNFFTTLGGYDPGFCLPGGGYANLDFFERCCAAEGGSAVLLAGEGTFHQYHGGVTTGLKASEYGVSAHEEYRRLRGRAYSPPQLSLALFGKVSAEVLPWIRASAEARIRRD
jgi:hypothetical protein